jgi:hypothetical protein
MILDDFQRFFRVPNFWWSTDIRVLLGCIKMCTLCTFLKALGLFRLITFGKTATFLGFCLVYFMPSFKM